ncbi:MAG: class I SAM-dependent rRNA methyltransferase, partial [Vicinamibacteria bacterium]|nr:class I SAM-dependent rRNA methyltransferase [Vicinamibacteria bacterium]
MSEALLKPRGLSRLETGHPWIFKSDVEPVEAANGEIVDVVAKGRFMGQAFYSQHSEITLRMLSRGSLTETWLGDRIERAIAFREEVLGLRGACRLVHGESDDLPGLIVDRYGDILVLQILAAAMETRLGPIVDALVIRLKPRGILARNDVKVREREGLPRETKTLWGDVPETVEIQEGSVTLNVDPTNGQKTGTFLDQSANHVRFGDMARGRVLDAFCHDGGFGLQAARNPAVKEVVAVDISAEALVRAQANAARNSVTLNPIEANVFDFLTDEVAAGSRFDTIALDPPAFAKTKSARDAAWRGYKEINRRALQLLEPGGLLLTCSCSYHVSEEEFEAVVADAAADSGITAQIIERRSQAADHPVRLGMPETRYL